MTQQGEIAIVGMAARVPGADNVETFWSNILDGHEAMAATDDEVARRRGVKEATLTRPEYRRVYAGAANLDLFDAEFFGLSPREAALADPQFRLFLELAHSSLAAGGYDPAGDLGRVGVYGGSTANDYREDYVEANPTVADAAGGMSIRIGNNPDYIAPLVSYKLGFQGPSLSVYTACSTSLVAVHLGVQALLLGEIDVAVAGGVQVDLPLDVGYVYEAGGIRSADGHVRPFSADASGTIFSNGGAVVVLKRLADARAAGDLIHGVLLGSAISNDGNLRAGFAAPGVDGQIKVVRAALERAGLTAREIGLMEAHGTGTVVGDPIEVDALTQAYRADTDEASYCALGSVKGNVGHLGPAAGVAGLIKATLAVREGIIPPTINWAPVNPAITLDDSPFRLATEPQPWTGQARRVAAVSSFGIGGTNAHVIVAPPTEPEPRPEPRLEPVGPHLLTLSARTPEALATVTDRLVAHLESTDVRLDDVAFTLHEGRTAHPVRRAVAARSATEAVDRLRAASHPAVPVTGPREVAFLLPGQGAQHPGAGRGLYAAESAYRDAVDACSDLLTPLLGLDLRTLLHADPTDDAAQAALARTAVTQPAIFTLEWALAALWKSRGVVPAVLVGHSVGELTAATIAGVFSLEDALRVVAARGRLMQSVAPGAMLALPVGVEAAADLLPADLEIAADNSPSACVVSGTEEAVARFAAELEDIGITGTPLRTSHAFHSRMMEPILDEFAAVVAATRLAAPTVPFLSNVTGDWADPEQVTHPGYWVTQLRQPVRFRAAVTQMIRRGNPFLLEVGPGRALGAFARQTAIAQGTTPEWAGSLPTVREGTDERDHMLATTGALWAAGVPVDLAAVRTGPAPRRVELPGYPYERRRHWVDPDLTARTVVAETEKIPNEPLQTPFYVPVWTQAPRTAGAAEVVGEHWLVLGTDPAFTAEVGAAALAHGVTVTRLDAGPALIEDFGVFEADPEDPTQIREVVEQLWDGGRAPDRVIVGYDVPGPAGHPTGSDPAPAHESYRRAAVLSRALLDVVHDPVELVVVTSRLFSVAGEESVPFSATALGPFRALPREAPKVTVRHIDLDGVGPARLLAARLIDEVRQPADEAVALRGHRRAVRSYATLPHGPVDRSALRPGGVYVVTGGLGGLGITIAESLAGTEQARLVLVGRTALPERARWTELSEAAETDEAVRGRIEAVLRMERLGAQVRVIAADVADPDAMATVLKETVAEFGVVHGIIHAAGLVGGQLLALHDEQSAARVLRPKVDAVLALYDQLTTDEYPELDFVALCSSIVAITSGYGLCDYAAANLFMDAFANSVADRPGRPRVVSMNWVGWREVGMVADQGASQGVQALRALSRGDRTELLDHPFLESVTVRADGTHRYQGVLSPDGPRALTEHRIADAAVVPATMLLESVRAAAHHALGEVPVRIQDLLFSDPIVVTEPLTLVLSFAPGQAAEGAPFEITVGVDGSGPRTVHCQGVLRTLDEPAGEALDLDRVRAALPAVDIRRRSSGMVAFGPYFDVVREYFRAGDTGLARLVSDDADPRFWLHPALLDQAAHGLAGAAASYLPFSYAGVRVYAPIPADAWVLQTHRQDPDRPEFIEVDETIVDRDGRVCVAVDSYVLRAQPAAGATPAAPPTQPTGDGPAAAGPPAGSSAAASGMLISSAQGIELFRRMLAVPDQPQLITSVGSLQDRIDEMRSFSTDVITTHQDTTVSAGTARADYLGGYVPPETDAEIAVAELWSQALGISPIGLDDEFLVLGGSSLTAVQLSSRTRERFGIQLSVAELFEHSTVRRLAVLVDNRVDALLDRLVDQAAGPQDGWV
ncbi:acyltransferase domain-containing protein [Micromonospora peucetia]|uniref:type I polyketide synthase n=1 Tax=Micromonospora peucetia TaxID=47871 RepID=UPI0022540A8C|nr:type I polyketide synthase [Micromonospora peucetia]MCX4386336.1 acyltransferase domain-containing protein [Micromonospora peucetia]